MFQSTRSDVEDVFVEEIESGLAIGGLLALNSLLFEKSAHEAADKPGIVDNQCSHTSLRIAKPPRPLRGALDPDAPDRA